MIAIVVSRVLSTYHGLRRIAFKILLLLCHCQQLSAIVLRLRVLHANKAFH